MRPLLFALVIIAAQSLYADDAAVRADLLQAALAACQQQTADANAQALQKIATLTVQRDALAKRVQELEQATK